MRHPTIILSIVLLLAGALPASAGKYSHSDKFEHYEGTATCLECHEDEAKSFFHSQHYQWTGDAPEILEAGGQRLGKMNTMNDFCTNPMPSWIGNVPNAEGNRTITPAGEPFEIPCDLALLAIGFDGVERMPLLDELDIDLNRRGAIACGPDWQTSAPGVFVCGDAHRGASLVVWAIAEGRSAAHAVDAYLTGSSELPAPVHPTALPLRAG